MAQSSLTFQKLEKFWQVIGVLTDELGNTFRVFVTGVTRRDVDRFINYQQRHQGISIVVRPGARKSARPQGDALAGADGGAKPFAAQVGGVTVSISRLHMVTKPPYTITYTIDPPAPVDPPFKTEFSLEKSNVKVVCTATRGSVNAELLELDVDGLTPLARTSQTIVAPDSGSLTATRQASGTWQVKVVEAEPSSYFKLSWDRVVT
jgi:hypothetical protein